MIFDCDEIHEIRTENAKRRAKMTKEEARRDLSEGAEKARRAIEEIRRAKAAPVRD
ncbi:MAG: hypothetical protein LBO21_02345 [Synergistaceae bacterium]|jgi:hypothetical protein|nr:hypothetical protein [Synergistaceae bacterium]